MRTTDLSRGAPGTAALFAGLLLTVLAGLAALLDPVLIDSVGDQVRTAYPQWEPDLVQTEQNAIIGWLVGTGVLGVLGWLWTIWAVRAQKRWARGLALTGFLLGALVAGLNLTVGGAAYQVIVPTLHGTLSLLPVIAGAVALVQLWRGGRPATQRSVGVPAGHPVRPGA